MQVIDYRVALWIVIILGWLIYKITSNQRVREVSGDSWRTAVPYLGSFTVLAVLAGFLYSLFN